MVTVRIAVRECKACGRLQPCLVGLMRLVLLCGVLDNTTGTVQVEEEPGAYQRNLETGVD